jgi:IS30 family transposase
LTSHGQLREVITAKLNRRWSPQQISRFLARSYPDQPAMHVCAETIYRGLYDGTLGTKAGKLRTGRTVRKAQRRGVAPPNKIKNMKPISQRPAEACDRNVPGHWEGDLLIGQKMTAAIGTLVERATRYVILVHLPYGYKAPQLRDAVIAACAQIPPALRKTLTWDQGREMAMHQQIETATGTQIFFCDPHSPWQRPTNENTNGLLRQYFPKHTDLSIHTADDLQAVAQELNQRPRIILGDRTPEEIMKGLLTTTNTSKFATTDGNRPRSRGRLRHSVISSMTLSVIRLMVSRLTVAPYTSAKCAAISPVVSPRAVSDNTMSSTPVRRR